MRTLFLLVVVVLALFGACTEKTMPSVVEEVTTVTEVCADDCLRGWFSPDGATVAYTGAKYRGMAHFSLNDRRLTVISTAEGAGLVPAWPSPIAAGPAVGMGERGVMVVPSPGASPIMLADGSHSPRRSPDGKRVVYIRGNYVRVYTVDTGEDRALIAGSQPAWLPDSSGVVVAVTRDDGRDVIASELYRVSLDGAKRRIRTAPGSIPLYPDVAGTRLLYTDHAAGRIIVHALETE